MQEVPRLPMNQLHHLIRELRGRSQPALESFQLHRQQFVPESKRLHKYIPCEQSFQEFRHLVSCVLLQDETECRSDGFYRQRNPQ